MTRVADLYRRRPLEARDNQTTAISLLDYGKMFAPGSQFNYNGRRYQGYQLSGGGSPGAGYYDTNAVVFACTSRRQMVFSEARFQFQRIQNGRPGDLFGTEALRVLEEPWVGATTGELLAQAELDVTCYGNSYWVNDGPYLLRLEPSNVTVVTIGAFDREVTGYQVGEKLAGYLYRSTPQDPGVFYDPTQIAHYKPYPDRLNRFIGVSWLNACLPDIDADQKLTQHKQATLADGAQIPYVVNFDKDISTDAFLSFVQDYRANHEGANNAGKTLFLGPGADIKTVGQTFENLAVKATQGAGETRIAADAGVPPIIVGLSEGLEAATYSNYGQARRAFIDATLRPLWRFFASSLQSVVDVPAGARLWYDDRDIPFLREDMKDAAEIAQIEAATAKLYIDGGFLPDGTLGAVAARDLRLLVGQHSGLYSVQLQAPGGADRDPAEQARYIAELVQKIYLGVDVILTADEARDIANRAGAGLSGSLPKPPAPALPPAA